MPELRTLELPADWPEVLTGPDASVLAGRILPEFLSLQRWYADKEGLPSTVIFADRVHLVSTAGDSVLAFIDVSRAGVAPQRYMLPLAIAWATDADEPFARLRPHVLARVRRGANLGVLYDATASGELPRLILGTLRGGRDVRSAAGGCLACRASAAFEEFSDVTGEHCRRLGVEQSNTSVLIDDRVIVKLYRRLQTGIHPEIEIGRFLTDIARYANAPRLLGSLERVGSDGSLTAVAVVHEFVRNQGDGWAMTLDHLGRMLDEFDLWLSSEEETFDAAAIHKAYWLRAETLARRIGELHRALALDVTDPAFAPEAVSADDLAAWTGLLSELAAKARDSLGRAVASDRLSEEAMGLAKRLMNDWGTIEKMCVVPAAAHAGTLKTRIHGDLHLGQVVVTGADFYVLDFEGEPLHAIERRRAKYSPLRDVAGMIRSFDYAGNAVLQQRRPGAQTGDGSAAYRAVIEDWRRETTERFLAAYRDSVAGCPAVPQQHQPFAAALHVYVLEKALYELCYEAANRPDWLAIPLAGVGRLLDRAPPPD